MLSGDYGSGMADKEIGCAHHNFSRPDGNIPGRWDHNINPFNWYE